MTNPRRMFNAGPPKPSEAPTTYIPPVGGKQQQLKARNLSRAARAKLGYAGSLFVASAGVGVELGVGWGLVAGGVASAVSFLFLAETED